MALLHLPRDGDALGVAILLADRPLQLVNAARLFQLLYQAFDRLLRPLVGGLLPLKRAPGVHGARLQGRKRWLLGLGVVVDAHLRGQGVAHRLTVVALLPAQQALHYRRGGGCRGEERAHVRR